MKKRLKKKMAKQLIGLDRKLDLILFGEYITPKWKKPKKTNLTKEI